jgi:hypothetical protein
MKKWLYNGKASIEGENSVFYYLSTSKNLALREGGPLV